MPDPSLPERAKVEVMAIQALCRWPRLSGEIGVQADFFRTDKKLAALAEALDKAQFLNSDGSVQLLDLATRARVDWQWLRQQFGATFLHVDQGRGWVEQLAQAEAELRLRVEVEGVFKERHGPGLLEALADVVARHQSAPVANGSNGSKDIATLTARYIDDRMEALATGRSSAVSTGMPTLDRFFKGGWRRKEVTILLAGAGVGKTTFADHLRRLLAQKGWSSLLFSAEMSEEQLAERQAHASAAVELDRELDMDDLREASGRIRGDQAWLRHLEVDEAPTITPGRMIARARARIAAGVPLALLVADTLGKVRVHDRREGGRNGSGGDDSEYNRLTLALLAMKPVAKAVPTAVLVIHHLKEGVGAPSLLDAHGTRHVGREADNVIGLWREGPVTKLRIMKARQTRGIEPYDVQLAYDRATQHYMEVNRWGRPQTTNDRTERMLGEREEETP